jgi:SAM-dependent methyltransferase
VAALLTGYHELHLTPDPARTPVWQAIAAHLARWIPQNGAVLEIGAGYCDWINSVRAGRRVAVDRWPSFVTYASPDVEAIVLDLATGFGNIGDGTFDAVLASNVLEHFSPDDVADVVSGVRRVLRPGGRLLVIQPNFRYASRAYFDDYTHRSIFTDVSLPALLRVHGFAIDRVEPRFLPYSMRHARIPIARWLVSAYLRSPIRPGAGQMLVIATKP